MYLQNIANKFEALMFPLLVLQAIIVYTQYTYLWSYLSVDTKYIGLIDEFCSLIFCAFLLLKSKSISIPNILWIPLFLVVPYMFVSMLLNNTPIINLVMAYRAYFIYIPTIITVSVLFKNNNILKSNRLMMFLLAVQCIVVFFQIISNYTNNQYMILGDALRGTFVSANNLGYTLAISMIYLYVKVAYKSWVFSEKIDQLLLVISAYLLFLIESRGAVYGLIIVFSVLIVFVSQVRMYTLRKVHFIIFVVITGTLIYGNYYLNEDALTLSNHSEECFQELDCRSSDLARKLKSAEETSALNNNFTQSLDVMQTIRNEQSASGGSNRLLWFPLTYKHLQEYAYHPLIGIGPSTHSSHAAVTLRSEIALTQVINAFDQNKYGMDGGVDSQIIPVWAEYGYIGLFLFYMIYIYIGLYGFLVMIRSNKASSTMSGVLLMGMSTYIVLLSYVNHVWESQPESFTFWLLVMLSYLNIDRSIE